jgi:hypothetical protein
VSRSFHSGSDPAVIVDASYLGERQSALLAVVLFLTEPASIPPRPRR